jgi:hypothetical protein
LKFFFAFAVVFAGWLLPLHAAPLDPKQVSADAKWVIHMDVDALKQSTVMQRAYAKEASRWKDIKNRMAAIRDQMCMDPTVDLHAVTLYGPKPGRTDGVMIVHAAVDQKEFVGKVGKAPGYRTMNHGPYTLHSWTQADGPVSSAFFDHNLVLLAKTDADVTAALDVLDGKSPSLAGKSSPLAGAPPSGTILIVRAIGLAGLDIPFKSPLLNQCESFDLVAGEDKGQSFSEAHLATRSAAVAGQVRKIIEGIEATLELQYGSEPAVLGLLKGVRVEIADQTVNIAVRTSADELWKLIEKISSQTAEKPAK